jgi:hypothetical protein
MLNGYRAAVNTADYPKNAVSKNVGCLTSDLISRLPMVDVARLGYCTALAGGLFCLKWVGMMAFMARRRKA